MSRYWMRGPTTYSEPASVNDKHFIVLSCFQTCTELQRLSAPQIICGRSPPGPPEYKVCRKSREITVRTQQGISLWIHREQVGGVDDAFNMRQLYNLINIITLYCNFCCKMSHSLHILII